MTTTNTSEFDDLTAAAFAELLEEALEDFAREYRVPLGAVRTFADAGLLTTDQGLVVRVGAREFQLTVVRSR